MIDAERDYAEYLDRFAKAIGDAAVGAFVKHQSHLIQKLDPEAFAARNREYLDLAGHYLAGLERGDTVPRYPAASTCTVAWVVARAS